MRLPKNILDARITDALLLIKSKQKNSNISNPIKIEKIKKSYANAFGANMVISSPLMACILLNKNNDKSKNEDNIILDSLLFELLKKQNNTITSKNLIDHVSYLNESNKRISFKDRMDLAIASVALKIALRTFPDK